jgi:hypothetical protein
MMSHVPVLLSREMWPWMLTYNTNQHHSTALQLYFSKVHNVYNGKDRRYMGAFFAAPP